MSRQRVIVRVPATTANLGPGFDCLGMALAIFNLITVELSDRFSLGIDGEGATFLPHSQDNAVHKAIATTYQRLGKSVPPLKIICQNDIPIGRGLGSSAAAAIGGLVAANVLCGTLLAPEELLKLGRGLEGHPDNVTPALLGGCNVVVTEGEEIVYSSVPLPKELRGILFIPDFVMPTKESRRLLPQWISRADAVYNIGRASLLVTALANGQMDLLQVATQDRLHQAARQQLFPAMSKIFEAAITTGALAVFLSGAGSSILAFSHHESSGIGEAMAQAARGEGINGQVRLADPYLEGTKVLAVV